MLLNGPDTHHDLRLPGQGRRIGFVQKEVVHGYHQRGFCASMHRPIKLQYPMEHSGPLKTGKLLINPDNWIMSTEVVEKGKDLSFGKPQKLFQMVTAFGGFAYDVSRDGKKFALVSTDNSLPAPIILVTNWTAELKK